LDKVKQICRNQVEKKIKNSESLSIRCEA